MAYVSGFCFAISKKAQLSVFKNDKQNHDYLIRAETLSTADLNTEEMSMLQMPSSKTKNLNWISCIANT